MSLRILTPSTILVSVLIYTWHDFVETVSTISGNQVIVAGCQNGAGLRKT